MEGQRVCGLSEIALCVYWISANEYLRVVGALIAMGGQVNN